MCIRDRSRTTAKYVPPRKVNVPRTLEIVGERKKFAMIAKTKPAHATKNTFFKIKMCISDRITSFLRRSFLFLYSIDNVLAAY